MSNSYCKREDFNLAKPQLDKGSFYNLVQISNLHILKNYIYNNYSAENLAIMANDEDYLKKNNPSLFTGYLNNKRRDRRTPMQYMQDIVASWIIEDVILTKITRLGRKTGILLKIKHVGCDKNRTILVDDTIEGTVTNKADFVATINNLSIPLELSICFKKSYIRLRNDKCNHLIEEKALLLHIEILGNNKGVYDYKCVIVSPKYMQEKGKKEFFKTWNKSVCKLPIEQYKYRDLDSTIIKAISDYILYNQRGEIIL